MLSAMLFWFGLVWVGLGWVELGWVFYCENFKCMQINRTVQCPTYILNPVSKITNILPFFFHLYFYPLLTPPTWWWSFYFFFLRQSLWLSIFNDLIPATFKGWLEKWLYMKSSAYFVNTIKARSALSLNSFCVILMFKICYQEKAAVSWRIICWGFFFLFAFVARKLWTECNTQSQ